MNGEPGMSKTVFRDEGCNPNGSYIIWEYENGTPVYQYTGYDRGGPTMALYPHHAIVKGTRREKRDLPIKELVCDRAKK